MILLRMRSIVCWNKDASESSEAHVMSPLSVAHNGSKPKLILNLSYLNQFISVPKFKYQDIRCARDLFEKGDYFFQIRHQIRLLSHKHSGGSSEVSGICI